MEAVILRPVEMRDFLRIAIGTPTENEHLHEALQKIL